MISEKVSENIAVCEKITIFAPVKPVNNVVTNNVVTNRVVSNLIS